jgi:hypothetical protein
MIHRWLMVMRFLLWFALLLLLLSPVLFSGAGTCQSIVLVDVIG